MSIFDKVKGGAAQAKAKAEELAGQHHGSIDKAIDKAAGVADQRTKGKYSDKIDTARSKARQGLDKVAEKKRTDGQTPGELADPPLGHQDSTRTDDPDAEPDTRPR